MIRLKAGVSLDNTHPRLFATIAMAATIWQRYGAADLWITAANEEGHTTNPDPWRQFHRRPDGTCHAVDIRTWNIPTIPARYRAVQALTLALGAEWDVLYERPGQVGEHAHVQLDALPRAPQEGLRAPRIDDGGRG